MLVQQLLLFLLLLIARVSTGQFAGPTYTTATGLPNDNVTCIKQDKEGFLWIGTSNGLCRFDGTHFYIFPTGLLESNRIMGDLILDLEEDNDYMWVSHRFGVSRINKYSFYCENFQDPEGGPVYTINRAIRDIYKDRDGTIWLAGDRHLLRFDRDSGLLKIEWDLIKKRPQRAGTQVSKIINGGSEKLLLYLVNGWTYYDIKRKILDSMLINTIPVEYMKGENLRLRSYWNTFASNFYVSYDTPKEEMRISLFEHPDAIAQVKNIYVDSAMNIYTNSENSLTALLTNEKRLVDNKRRKNAKNSYQLDEFNYGSSIKDLKCWGRPDGLFIADKKSDWMNRYFFSKQAAASAGRRFDIMDVKEYDENHWLVAADGGLFLMNRTSFAITSFSQWNDSVVYTASVLPGKSVWLSTGNFVYHFSPASGKILHRIFIESYAVSIQHFNNQLLVATRGSGLFKVDLNNNALSWFRANDSARKISYDRITSVKPAGGSGKYFITYNNLGLFSFNDFSNGTYLPDSTPAGVSVFNEGFPLTAVQPGHKQLWIGQYIGGVLLYDSIVSQWQNFTKEEGLTSNYISEILNDRQGRTWIVTDAGIDIYDQAKKSIYRFPQPLTYGGRTGGFMSSKGNLVFFDKEKIIETNPQLFVLDAGQRKILYSRVIQDKRLLNIQNGSIILPYYRNTLSIIFSLQKLNPGNIARYGYRLKNAENWNDLGSETELNFASLKPGNYNLEIRATDEFGQWTYYSDILYITIQPPFWNTWWFYLLAAFVFFAVLWVIYRYRINQLRKMLAVRSKISKDLHDEVGATLSGVTLMSELAQEKLKTQKNEESQSLIGRITTESKEMAEKMNDIVWAISPANDSMEKVLNKIQGYGNNVCASRHIHFHFNRPADNEETQLNMQVRNNVYLISKEAINNAVKYSGAKNIRFNLSGKKNNYLLSIADDGKGFDTKAACNGNGLLNMKTRAGEIGGRLHIHSTPGAGTEIELAF